MPGPAVGSAHRQLRPLLERRGPRGHLPPQEHLANVEPTLAGDAEGDPQVWSVGLAGLEPAT
jgi:hypothetical protein